jgi:hypothetical protein
LGSALQALPLLFLDLKTAPLTGDVIDRGHFFLFEWNQEKILQITRFSRLASWLMGCLLGFWLFRITKQSLALLAFTLFFWAFDPLFLALSSLAKTDITPAVFFFLAVLAFQRAMEKPSTASSLNAGLVSALAILSKFYCLVLIPVFLVLEWLELQNLNQPSYSSSAGRVVDQDTKKDIFQEIGNRWLAGFSGFVLIALLVYFPGTLLLPDHREPLHYLFFKLRENLAFVHHSMPVFFLGHSGLESHWYYLPAAFLLKEPLPFILMLGASIMLAARGKMKIPAWQWVPPVLFTLAVLPAPNLGIRYLLPAFPFLFLIAGEGAAWLCSRRADSRPWGAAPLAVGGLVLWQAASVLLNFPHALSYFNDFVPKDKKIFFLADSNLDWGQDLKRLAETGRSREWGKVKLAYFGGVDPKAYGLQWEPWREDDLKAPQPGAVYAVNAGFFQLAPAAFPPVKTIAESWISRQAPTGKIADSWYFFEIAGAPLKKQEGPFLVSVPFQQFRGYTPWTPSRR